MISQSCPICGPNTPQKLLYKKNFNLKQVTRKTFSARRQPDRIHYRTVSCQNCGLVFANPIMSLNKINQLYYHSQFTYQNLIVDLQHTYAKYLNKLKPYQLKKAKLLEIGCANGFLLSTAKKLGYHQVWGVEPSRQAILKAPANIKKVIKNSNFNRRLFPKNSFDVICSFHTFDHLNNPNQVLKDCSYLLKPQGLILIIVHNVKSLQAKILKSHSPIIDIEHPYLYSPHTLKLLFEKNNYQVLKTGSVINRYPINYLIHLLPLPTFVKKNLSVLEQKISLPLGNFFLIARRQS